MPKRGFTLVEALVAVALLAVGITAALGGLSALANAEWTARERERMHRLAIDKYDELRATQEADGTGVNGDFRDRGLDEYTWEADVRPTGVENLDALAVIVRRRGSDVEVQVDGLVYLPPAQGAGGAQ